jgi:hypothetical protein
MAKRGRPRKPGPRTSSGRLSRSARRIAERTIENARRRGEAVRPDQAPPRPARARHKSALEFLDGRGSITTGQRAALLRLALDVLADHYRRPPEGDPGAPSPIDVDHIDAVQLRRRMLELNP